MRWFVEITRVGKGDVLDELCVEAAHWQNALKKARALRHEGNALEGNGLEGLSVELVADGCHALDGATALRYLVSKAPDEEPLIERSRRGGAEALGAASSSVVRAPVGERGARSPVPRAAIGGSVPVVSVPVVSALGASGGLKPAGTVVERRQVTAKLEVRPAPSSVVAPAAKTGSPSVARPARPAAQLDYDEAPVTPPSGTPTNQPRPSLVGRAPTGPTAASPAPMSHTFELLSSRTSPATGRMLLAHHERSYGLRVDLSVGRLKAFALERLEDVRSELLGTRTGNVVDIAVFAQPFEGRPTEAPLATLRWCDWIEAPVYVHDPFPTEEEPAERHAANEPLEFVPDEPPQRPLTKPALPAPGVRSRLEVAAAAPPVVAQPSARPKVLPTAAPMKATMASFAAPAPAAPEAVVAAVSNAPLEPSSVSRASSTAAREAAVLLEEAPSEDAFLTSKRPLGSRRSPLGARMATKVSDEKSAVGGVSKTESKIASPGLASSLGPVAGSRPAAATRVGGGAELPVSGLRLDGATSASSVAVRVGATAAPRVAALGSSRSLVHDSSNSADGRSGGNVVAASAGPFESSAGPARPSRMGQPAPQRVLSREEKEVKFDAARGRAATVSPPSVRPGKRVAGDELLTDLFESLSDLHFQADALEAAGFVLALALEKLPSHVGMVSMFDLDRREYVVVRQEGGTRSSLLLRGPERAPFVEEAMKANRAIVTNDTDALTSKLDLRWSEVGAALRSFVCAPVVAGGRTLGLIELADPSDGSTYEPADGNALTYIAKQYAEFLETHGILLDPDAILAAAELDQGR